MSDDVEDLATVVAGLLHKDRKAIFKPAILNKLVAAYIDDPGTWLELRDLFRTNKILKEVEPRVKAKAHALQGIPVIGQPDTGEKTIADVWDGIEKFCPNADSMYPPPRYKIHDNSPAIERVEMAGSGEARYEKAVPVSLDPIVICRRMGQIQTGQIKLEIAWQTHHGWRKTSAPRDVFFSTRKIVDLASNGIPVASGNAHEVSEWLRHFENHNRHQITEGYASAQMGWQGEEGHPTHHGFLCGRTQIGANGRAIELDGSDGDMADARSIRERGELSKWQAAIARVWRYPSVRIGIFAALATPLIAIVGAPNGIIEFAGRTSRGKTTVLQLAKSCWRSARLDMGTWDTTVVGIEAMIRFQCDMPVFLDETSVAQEGGRNMNIGKAIYKIIAGRDRGRGDRNSQQRVSYTWRTIVLATGETPLGELAKAEGAAARVLTFWAAPFGEVDTKTEVGVAKYKATATLIRETIDACSEHYGHAGPMFVRWLCENRERWDDIIDLYKGISDQARNLVASPAASRLASVVALLHCASKFAAEAGILPCLRQTLMKDDEVRELIVESMKHASKASDRAREAFELVTSEAMSRRSAWIEWNCYPNEHQREPPSGWLGFVKEGERWGWYPNHLRSALIRGGFLPEQIFRAWKDVGLLLACQPDRFTSVCRPHPPGDRRAVRLIVMSDQYPGTHDDEAPSPIDDDVPEAAEEQQRRLPTGD